MVAENPPVHPAFISTDTNSIYHELKRVKAVLDEVGIHSLLYIYIILLDISNFQYEDNPEIRELQRICNEYINPEHELPLRAKHPVIVIEGLDATGIHRKLLTSRIDKFIFH